MDKNYLSRTDFILLLLSYLKLDNIDKIDVLQLGYALKDCYYVNDYRSILSTFIVRETINKDEILDIDDILMDAYLFGYLDDKRNILLTDEYICKNVIPLYNNEFNKLIKDLAREIKSKFPNYEPDDKRNFISDLFFKRVHKFKK